MTGRAFAVVGPSGVGKDTLIAACVAARPDLVWVRRAITRPESAGGEPFEGISAATFEQRVADGAFAVHWQAHGLGYGIPATALLQQKSGADIILNGSRAVFSKLARVFAPLTVFHVTARPEILAARLAERGREDAAQIAKRLARQVPQVPEGLIVVEIDNSGTVEAAVEAMLAVLQPESA